MAFRGGGGGGGACCCAVMIVIIINCYLMSSFDNPIKTLMHYFMTPFLLTQSYVCETICRKAHEQKHVAAMPGKEDQTRILL